MKSGSRDTRRRFEQWAQNPLCEANTISAVHGISMAAVAASEGLKPSMGQSPFAIARGQSFERTLFREKAKALREELERHGVLKPKSSGFVDLRMRLHGGPMRDLDQARERTLELLRQIAAGKEKAAILASPTLLIPSGVMLPEALLVVDVIAVRHDGQVPRLTVGEIKTYPDRGGYTDGGELALARAQAGVYVHALRMVVEEQGLTGRIEVAERGFLVLSRPGYNRPSVRANEDLRYQAIRARRGFDMLEAAAEKLPTVPPPSEEARLLAVANAPVSYEEGCIGFCDRVEGCRGRALLTGNPAILGEDVVRLSAGISLHRVDDLFHRRARPATESERELLEALKDVTHGEL